MPHRSSSRRLRPVATTEARWATRPCGAHRGLVDRPARLTSRGDPVAVLLDVLVVKAGTFLGGVQARADGPSDLLENRSLMGERNSRAEHRGPSRCTAACP